MYRLTHLLGLLSFSLAAACGQPAGPVPVPHIAPVDPIVPTDRIDLTAHIDDAWSVEAVAIDGDRVLSLLPGRGVLATNRAGDFLQLYAFGENGFPDLGYADLDVLPDGRFALAAPDEAIVWDPETHALESYFCLEPGFGEIVMQNRALTVDHETGRIIGAPTYYDTTVSFSEPISSFHVSYTLEGDALGAIDVLDSGIVAEGLALLDDDRLLAVDGSSLVAFDSEGFPLEHWELSGIKDASGLAIDEDGRILVSDRADLEVRAFALDDLSSL